MAKRIGPSWRGHVWENMGWHYRAERRFPRGTVVLGRKAEFHVHRHGPRNYWASLILGSQYLGDDVTAKKAAAAALAAANEVRRALIDALGTL